MHNLDNSTPVYLQIAEKIAMDIFGGKFEPGTQLPTVREIALSEWVNPNTVQKALAELERDNLIISRSTQGKFVTEDIELITKKREEYATKLTEAYKQKMQSLGAKINIPKIIWPSDIHPNELTEMNKNFKSLPKSPKKERRKWFF